MCANSGQSTRVSSHDKARPHFLTDAAATLLPLTHGSDTTRTKQLLKLCFTDLRLCLRDGRHHLATLAIKTRGLALQRRLACEGYETLLVKTLHTLEFAGDQLMLRRFRFDLGVETRNVFTELPNMTAQEIFGCATRRGAAVEQRNLRCPRRPISLSPERLAISCGRCGWSSPSRSAIRRASRTRVWSSCCVRTCALARSCVSSRRRANRPHAHAFRHEPECSPQRHRRDAKSS